MKKMMFSILILISYYNAMSQTTFWEPIELSSTQNIVYSLLSDNSGYIFTTLDGISYRSNDNGKSWMQIDVEGFYDFTLNREGVVFGASGLYANGAVFYSIDHGETWIKTNFNEDPVHAIAINSLGHIFAASVEGLGNSGAPGLYRSTDNGNSWDRIMQAAWFSDLFIDNNDNLFVTQDIKLIRFSEDNGETWELLTPDEIAVIHSLSINSKGDIFAISSYSGQRGGVYLSTDQGNDWSQVLSIGETRSILISQDDRIYIGTEDNGVYFSNDNGKNWQQINTGLTNLNISAFTIDPSNRIMVGTYGGGLFRSIDPITSVRNNPSFDIKRLTLKQNYPNPFNSYTLINYELSANSEIELTLYNIRGQKIKTLYKGFKTFGVHQFKLNANSLPSGMYIYQIKSNKEFARHKLLLLK